MRTFLKRLWLRRWVRGCVWAGILLFAALIAALILGREYVDWSGSRRWATAQEMLAREGESIDFRKNAPDPVPDDLNFCAIPALKDLPLALRIDDDKTEAGLRLKRLFDTGLPRADSRPELLPGAAYGAATDMKAWDNWLRKNNSPPLPPASGDPARDVLAALSKNDALVSELALGLTRPESQWTPAWKTRTLPTPLFGIPIIIHSSATQGLISTLGLRSAAAARAGDAAKAHESLLIAVRITQANMYEPCLIGTSVACGETAVINGAVWELCDAHCGTEEDFFRLQQNLSRLDFEKSFLYGLRGELALGVDTVEYLKRSNDRSLFFDLRGLHQESGNSLLSFVFRIIPDGWFDGNAATISQWDFDYYIKPLRDQGLMKMLSRQQDLDALMIEERSRFYPKFNNLLADIAVPYASSVSHRVIYTQTVVNQAIAACALERYRIEHNAYPDTLETANRAGEKSIPLDIISGKPMGYRKTAGGSYALWCVAFNGKDHGGIRALDTIHPERTNFWSSKYAGDWVWDFQ